MHGKCYSSKVCINIKKHHDIPDRMTDIVSQLLLTNALYNRNDPVVNH